jgi:hypothetical protein
VKRRRILRWTPALAYARAEREAQGFETPVTDPAVLAAASALVAVDLPAEEPSSAA